MELEDKQRFLNEYEQLGAYHRELRLSRAWLPRYFRRFHVALRVLKDLLTPDATIADIGAGEGVFIQKLEETGFHRIVGIDPFAPLENRRVLRGDICALPFSPESFDAITCFDVLEHIPLDRQGLAASEIAQILKPGGLAVISVPNMAHLRSRMQFFVKGRPWRNNILKHPGELSAHERIEVLSQAGLQCVDKVGLHLTLTYNPRPRIPLGRLVSKFMFSPNAPCNLCWTVVFLCSKSPVPERLRRLRNPLKDALRSYQPVEKDPTKQ